MWPQVRLADGDTAYFLSLLSRTAIPDSEAWVVHGMTVENGYLFKVTATIPRDELTQAVGNELTGLVLSLCVGTLGDGSGLAGQDQCPDDPNKSEPGYCGCGHEEVYYGDDGILDECMIASTPNDLDADGVPDTADNCSSVNNPTQHDSDGDGLGDPCESEPPAGTLKIVAFYLPYWELSDESIRWTGGTSIHLIGWYIGNVVTVDDTGYITNLDTSKTTGSQYLGGVVRHTFVQQVYNGGQFVETADSFLWQIDNATYQTWANSWLVGDPVVVIVGPFPGLGELQPWYLLNELDGKYVVVTYVP